jgi:pimeloyl-ACP methyl ester carboxylesterase
MEQKETSPATRPWNLDALRQVPAFAWADANPVRSLYYEGEPYQGRPTRVYAHYATPGTLSGDPAKDVNLPAIVLVHGGLGTAFPQWAKLWAERGYAVIAMDLSGVGPGRKRLPDGGPDQGDEVKFHTMDQPVTDQWTYHAVANVIRAHSLIRSFPEVDPENTATIGISWGGYLACIVAGLDDRFKAAASIYGCGFIHEHSAWLSDFEKMPDAERQQWVQLWEPSRYVGSAAMPMFFVSGGKDRFYPPDSLARTMDLIPSPVNLHYVPDFPHGYYFDKPKALEVFVDQHLKDGVPLPMISAPMIESDQVAATVETATALMTAELHYTTDDLRGVAEKRNWVSLKAGIEGNVIHAERPPAGATCWFLTATDEREVTVSSRIMILKKVAGDHPSIPRSLPECTAPMLSK